MTYSDAKARVEEFRLLDDNWDGDHTYAPSAKSCWHATIALGTLEQWGIPVPEAQFPCDDRGGIELEWTSARGSLITLLFSNTKTVRLTDYSWKMDLDLISIEGPIDGPSIAMGLILDYLVKHVGARRD